MKAKYTEPPKIRLDCLRVVQKLRCRQDSYLIKEKSLFLQCEITGLNTV
jgi:hypothetical protein